MPVQRIESELMPAFDPPDACNWDDSDAHTVHVHLGLEHSGSGAAGSKVVHADESTWFRAEDTGGLHACTLSCIADPWRHSWCMALQAHKALTMVHSNETVGLPGTYGSPA